MSTVDLLAPRYKVIADYYQGKKDIKDNRVKRGHIFMNSMPQQDVVWRKVVNGEWVDETIHNPQQLPNLFQPLPWYAERKVEDMPEYVKLNPENTTGEEGVFKVLEVKKYNDGTIGINHTHPAEDCEPFEAFVGAKYFLPATLEEYTEYINSQKK